MRALPVLLCLCLGAALPLAQAADKRIPVSAFANEDQFSNPQLSPDGKYLVITTRLPRGDRFVPTVTVYALPGVKLVSAVQMKIFEVPAHYMWVSNRRLVVTKGLEVGSREAPRLTGEVLAMDFDGSKQEYLYGYNNFAQSRRGDRYGDDYGYGDISTIPRERNGHLYLSSQLWQTPRSMLYDIDASGAARKLLADIPVPDLEFLSQHDGKPRFAFGLDQQGYNVLFRFNDQTGAWDDISAASTGRGFTPIAFAADDSEFMATFTPKGGPELLVREKTATGERSTVLQSPDGAIDEFMYGSRRDLPFAAWSHVGMPKVSYFDENSADARLHKMLSQQFPGSLVRFYNFTDDGKQMIFGVSSDRDPGSFYLFDLVSNKATLLLSSMEELDPDDMAPRTPISFRARDGLSLHGYLTLPKHEAGKKLPLVLMPHGGPFGIADSWGFNTDAQFLASRGYAVLQVNYRGSGGRGPNFRYAGYRQWGGKIQDDLVDGLKWAIAQGEVDGARVCVYGGSFGGYSALMLAARDTALFKCAVGYAGVYDIQRYKDDPIRKEKRTQASLARMVGDDKDELARFSPVKLAERITIPVLLVHGGKDERAPKAHAEDMRDALIRANHAPEWMYVDYEGHGFYDTRNVTAFYEKLEAFLAKHIGK